MERINAPYNFVPLSDTVVIPEWGDKVSHDLPFRDGISGELELTIEALAPIMVGGEQKPGTEREAGQVHFFQTPDKRYAIPGSSLRGVIRSVTEIATFSRMNRIDDKRFGLRDISGTYVSASYTERVRNNVSYGFLHLNAQGKPAITPCSMVRLSHRDLESWWKEKSPIFVKQRKTVKDKYITWEQLCTRHGIRDSWEIPFQTDHKLVTQIGSGNLTGFPVLTGQISDSTDDKPRTKGKYKDFMFYSQREQDKFVLDNSTWRDFLFIHGDEDGKPDSPWKGFWRNRFWDKQKVPVFYIQNKDRVQVGLAYMPKLAGDFSTHDMLQHTHKDHVENTKPDFAELLFGRVDEKPESALKGRVYFEPAILQDNVIPVSNPPATILNGAKPSYFPNYVYQQVDKSGNELANGKNRQYATYVYSAGNPAPELRGWKRYPVRLPDEVRTQPLGDKQTTKVQTRLHTLAEGSTFKGRLVFHNLKPQELGALLWAVQLENKRHNLGMAKSFGYGQINIRLDWQNSRLVCNDPAQIPDAEPDGYIATFKQYMTTKLGKDWRASTPIEALVAMADLTCRDQFAGKLKHMVMGMVGNNEFVKAKQAGLVLASYVKDHRTLKRKSHVSVTLAPPATNNNAVASPKLIVSEPELWQGARIKFNRANGTLSVEKSGKIANALKPKGEKLLDNLPAAIKQAVMKNQFIKVNAYVQDKEIIKIEAT